MRRYLPFVIVGAVALLTLGSATLLYRSKRPFVSTSLQNRTASATNDADSVHALGPANAPVTLEEFGDFQCPPCGALSGPINQLEKEYHSSLRVIFREFPLPNHQHARDAAFAAEAAARQGRFWEMHDLLYREQAVWSKSGDVRTLFNAYAAMLGLDMARFKKDMDSDEVRERVAIDQRRGALIGIQTTPTIFLNNRSIAPKSLNPTDLRAEVVEAVKSAKPSS